MKIKFNPLKSAARNSLLAFLLLANSGIGASSGEKRLFAFYAKNYPEIQLEYLSEVVSDTKRYAKKLCLGGELDTLLSMAHRESHFDMFADTRPVEDSFGIYQTRIQYEGRLRRFWLNRGVTLGSIEDVETQCAFGVAEFWLHLQAAGGNIWGAVRRYNGSGAAAHRHAKKVFISRRVIFGRPHVDGEKVPVGCQE